MDGSIFLSYSRNDRQLAEQFVEAARARGVTVWFDEKIEGGQDWREGIVNALQTARALVILFSEHSNRSRQLIKELAIADHLQKLVIPVLVSDCEPEGAYLYEMASRNWINLFPNPETRLDHLIDVLISQLDLHGESMPHHQVDAATAMPTPREQMPAPPPLPRPTTTELANRTAEKWFPLRWYDFLIFAPVLIGGLLLSIWGTGENKYGGLGLTAIAAVLYMFVIGVRNARLNRSIFSGKSFVSYLVVMIIGFFPALVVEESGGGTVFAGLVIVSLVLAVIANILQVVLRKIFQVNLFRSRIAKPLAR